MGAKKTWAYEPDYLIPPGETLEETLEELGMTQKELAQRTGRPQQVINEIVKGKRAIMPETALQLERVLGVPANFWNNLETQYQDAWLRAKETEALEQQAAWVKGFKYAELVKKHYLPNGNTVAEKARHLMSFFGVASPDQQVSYYQSQAVAFRRSTSLTCDSAMLAAWLRAGERRAATIDPAPYSKEGFMEALHAIRALTTLSASEFVPEVQRLCAAAGVVVVWIPELSGCPVSGATRWLRNDRALIQLSLRYKADDQMWFSFFHEAGHIVLHGKRASFLDDGKHEGDQEQEADRFARNLLIPEREWARFVAAGAFAKSAIIAFAKAQGIAPSIVAGRLGHEGHLVWPAIGKMKLKRTLQWQFAEQKDV